MDESEIKPETENSDLDDAFVLDVIEIHDESDSDVFNLVNSYNPEGDDSVRKSVRTVTKNYRTRKNARKKKDDPAAEGICAKKYKIESNSLVPIEDDSMEKKKKETDVPPFLPNLRSQRLRQNYLKNVIQSVTEKSFPAASKLSTSSNEPEAEFFCSDCDSKFHKKTTLENHIKKFHSLSKREPRRKDDVKIECAECGKKFTKRGNLITHLRTIHKQTFINPSAEKPFICGVCNRGFSQNYNLKVHLQTIHRMQDLDPKKEKPFPCSVCGKHFGRKHSLKIHFATIHHLELEPPKEKEFECRICHKLFSRKPNLLRHCLKFHADSSNLKCLTCQKLFLTEEEIRNHVELCSRKQALIVIKEERLKNRIIRQTVVCALCKLTLHKIADMRRHYQNDHHLDMSSQTLSFASEEEFLSWKYQEETSNRCSFSRYRSYNIHKAKYVDFFCSRSGFYKDNNQGLRGRRAIGSKKINACCPSQIKLKHLGDVITVKYLSTHVGHDNKLCYMNLTKIERELIVEDLRRGMAPQEILQKIKYPLPASEDERRKVHLLTVQDIRNIAVTAGIEYKKGRFRDQKRVQNVATWVAEHEDAVPYFKAAGQYDEKFPELRQDDFLLVIMTESQRRWLQRVGPSVVQVDSASGCGDKSGDYALTTLMVLDGDGQSYPCLFMFSSRVGERFLNVFYECLRANMAEDAAQPTRTFVSGLQDSYYKAWIEVFPKPEYRLFSPWHVLKNWRENLNRITLTQAAEEEGAVVSVDELRRLKGETYKFLKYDLMEQRDPLVFADELSTFVELEKPALRPFQTFFERTYVATQRMWAHCFREQAGVGPNAFTESFGKVLKYQHSSGSKVRQLEEALAAVVAYLEKKNEAEILREEKGVHDTQKLRTLRRRHANSLKGNRLSIVALGPRQWIVPSGSAKGDALGESYCIRRRANECRDCYLVCRECGACIHDFECTCTDYCVFGNMCKHIHLLCQSLEGVPNCEDALVAEEEVIYDLGPDGEDVEYEIINTADLESLADFKEVDVKEELQLSDALPEEAAEGECAEVREQFNKVISGISSSPHMLDVAKKWVQQFSSIMTVCEEQKSVSDAQW